MNIRILRDMKARHGADAHELVRRAYLYVARNQTLPPQVRYQAQLQLNSFGKFARPMTVKNRCAYSGKGRGIMGEFAMSRVRPADVPRSCSVGLRRRGPFTHIQFQFRLRALEGEIPGVHKASW